MSQPEQIVIKEEDYQKEIRRLRAENDQLKIANQSLSHFSVKPRQPSTFNGKDRAEATPFIHSISHYFHTTGVTDELIKLNLAVGYLEKDALVWYNSVSTSNTVRTYTEFVQLFNLNYQPVDVQREAAQKLQRLTQTGSVKAYVELFRREALLVDKSKYPEANLKDLFVSHLKFEVQAHLIAGDVAQWSLEATMAKAQALDAVFWSAKQNMRATGNGGGTGGYNGVYRGNKAAGATGSSAAHPIVLGAVDAGNGFANDQYGAALNFVQSGGGAGRPALITDAEREMCLKKGLCFRCRKHGHMAANCSQFPYSKKV